MTRSDIIEMIGDLRIRNTLIDGKLHIVSSRCKQVELIMQGKKLIETRMAKRKSAPFDKIDPGDWIIFKKSSGHILAAAKAARVKYYSNLNHRDIKNLKLNYNEFVQENNRFWTKNINAQYATFIYLSDVIS